MKKLFLVIVLSISTLLSLRVTACTNFIITKGASADGSCMVSYAADSHTLYGELYFYPAANHPAGSFRDIIEWDTGERLGQIPEVAHTYSVVGNMNEYQLAIGETTYGGREELWHTPGLIDYGSPCHNCVDQLMQIDHHYKLGVEIKSVAEVVADALVMDSEK